MNQALLRCELEDLAVLRVQGADMVRFLQGQLSNDVQRLSPERSLLAGYHNPQGRVIALLRLVHFGEELLAILPRELLAPVAQRLRKFTLRSKVTLADASEQWQISGLIGEMSSGDGAPAPTAGSQRRLGETIQVCVGERPWRALELCARGGARPPATPASRERWRELDVCSGLPQVHAATSEQFVAQMLNLDAVGAISFDKGCYTGQEVIARAHYRGHVKRRMQRFRSRGPLNLQPADSGTLCDGRSFKVVEAARLEDGRCEFLAVAPLPGAEAQPAGATETTAALDVEALPLPYALPD